MGGGDGFRADVETSVIRVSYAHLHIAVFAFQMLLCYKPLMRQSERNTGHPRAFWGRCGDIGREKAVLPLYNSTPSKFW